MQAILRVREHVHQVPFLIADRVVLGGELADAVVEKREFFSRQRNDLSREMMLGSVLAGALFAFLRAWTGGPLCVLAIGPEACVRDGTFRFRRSDSLGRLPGVVQRICVNCGH